MAGAISAAVILPAAAQPAVGTRRLAIFSPSEPSALT
jgi:hypothetical protein